MQVVDQPGEVLDLPLHHRAHVLRRRRSSASPSLQDVQGVADRGQRVAELVGEHRQELVLAAVGLLQALLLLLVGQVGGDHAQRRRVRSAAGRDRQVDGKRGAVGRFELHSA